MQTDSALVCRVLVSSTQLEKQAPPETAALRETFISPAAPVPAALGTAPWGRLVHRIQQGDPGGMEELYRVFSRQVRFYICHQLGPQEIDDKVHDTFLIVVQAIRRGDLRQPERLMGFVRTVVHRQVAASIDRAVRNRKEQLELEYGARVADGRSNPERSVLEREQAELMVRVLQRVRRRDREILTRFYLLGHSAEQICTDMHLSQTQFRLLKSRAKTRFGRIGRRSLGVRSQKNRLRCLASGF